ncbi:hypothetical protein GGR51DRAFT_574890 [Nemania sp. FL0031]|nr:hypothetical protein GGR51DRAFT_574890 [Nemania sp. FL0031]
MASSPSMPNPPPESVAHMAMDVDNKYKYKAGDLSTRSVTIFRTHARIVREIKNIPISRERRQITITGLTSAYEQRRFEDSLKVEATIDAMIAILDIERVPNNDDTESVSIDDDFDDTNIGLTEKEDDGIAEDNPLRLKLRTLTRRISQVNAEKSRAGSAKKRAMERLQNLGSAEMDQSEWAKARDNHLEASNKEIDLAQEMVSLTNEKISLRKRYQGSRTRTARDKEKAQRCRRHLAQVRENERFREERGLRRPKEVYQITISIDINTKFEEGQGTYDLILHYATDGISWSPIYDMALSTATNSGVWYFDALLRNETSETWDNCSFTLSTLNTNIANRKKIVNYSVRKLGLWNVSAPSGRQISSFKNLMYSQYDNRWTRNDRQPERVPGTTRSVLGDLVDTPRGGNKENINPENDDDGLGTPSRLPIDDDDGLGTPSRSPIDDDDDSSFNDQSPSSQPIILCDADSDAGATDGPSLQKPGLAITYDLAGLKSLPRMKQARYRLDRITDIDVVFNRTVVPKHSTDVILWSEAENSSKSTMPQGMCGFTVDGKFLGLVELPLWAPGRLKRHDLGPDPSIQVSYSEPVPEPDMKEWRRSEKGNVSFTRTITVANTQDRALGRPLQVTVIDQIPVSKDQHLDITLVIPAGLEVDGPSVPTGESADDGAKDPWGKAEAKLKEGGEVEWTVTVNPGCATKLSLVYSCAFH